MKSVIVSTALLIPSLLGADAQWLASLAAQRAVPLADSGVYEAVIGLGLTSRRTGAPGPRAALRGGSAQGGVGQTEQAAESSEAVLLQDLAATRRWSEQSVAALGESGDILALLDPPAAGPMAAAGGGPQDAGAASFAWADLPGNASALGGARVGHLAAAWPGARTAGSTGATTGSSGGPQEIGGGAAENPGLGGGHDGSTEVDLNAGLAPSGGLVGGPGGAGAVSPTPAPTPPIPEPETYVLLVAGLGFVTFTLRRRRLDGDR